MGDRARILGVALFGFVASVGTAAAAWVAFAPAQEPLPTYYEVPSFALTDQEGKSFGSAELEGRIWVASFIFTHCPTVCEGLTEGLKRVGDRLGPKSGVQLVTFSVDPENDTPEVLRAYAEKRSLDQSRWRFLTGELAAMQKAVIEGFKLPMQRAEDGQELPPAAQLMGIAHGTRLVLVDRALQIRGYYEVDEPGLERLVADARRLDR